MSCPTWCWKLISGLLQWSCTLNHQAIPPAFFLSPVLTLPSASTFTCFSCKSRAGRAGSRMAETVKEKALMKKPFICSNKAASAVSYCEYGKVMVNLCCQQQGRGHLSRGTAFIKLSCEHAVTPSWLMTDGTTVGGGTLEGGPGYEQQCASWPLLKLFWGFLDGSDSEMQ